MFAILNTGLVVSTITATPIFRRREDIGKSFYDRLENYSLIFIIFWQSLVSALMVYSFIDSLIRFINKSVKSQ